MAAWFYFDDQHGLLPCTPQVSNDLETMRNKHLANPVLNPQCSIMTIAGTSYMVDVLLQEQMNSSTKRVRGLRRLECPNTILWEAEAARVPDLLLSTPKPPGTAAAFLPLSRYWINVVEFLRDRSNSSIHSSAKPALTIKSEGTDVVIDMAAMTVRTAGFGGLETSTAKIRRVIQAVEEEDTSAETSTASPGKRARVEPAQSSRVPKGGEPKITTATAEQATEEITIKKRGPVAAAPASIPATLCEDSNDSVEDAPLPKRVPHSVPAEAEALPPPPIAASSSSLPPGWGAVPLAVAPVIVMSPSVLPQRRLVFPSLSTAVFMFDLDIAAKVATREIAKFLAKHPASSFPWIKLSLIDFPKGPDTETIVAFKKQWAIQGDPSDCRFDFVTGDVSSFAERGAAEFIANASNASFNGSASTGGFNRAVYVAAGDKELQADTRAKYPKGASVGPCYEVPLRSTSPLYVEGTRYILHVVGPNMNPSRPNCLHGDYKMGCEQLEDCYHNMLATYFALASSS